MTANLAGIRYLFIDMDGVLYRGQTGLPGAPELIAFCHANSIRYLYVTNNSSQSPRSFAEKLRRMGISATEDEVMTSGVATARYLSTIAPPGTKVNVVGEEGLIEQLKLRGFEIAGRDAEYVVAGWDKTLTYDKLATACIAIRNGATFIGTNPDKTYPLEQDIVPGAGTIVAALTAATDTQPLIVGKPEPIIIKQSLDILGAQPEEAAMLGDRLDTDILGGARAGITTLMVLTGISTAEEAAAFEAPPDAIYDDLPALLSAWSDAIDAR